MSPAQSERRTDGRQRKILGPQIELILAGQVSSQPVTGRLADVSRGGFGFLCHERIEEGALVSFRDPFTAEDREGSVLWCRLHPVGDYRAGIAYRRAVKQAEAAQAGASASRGGSSRPESPQQPQALPREEDEEDYYERLQVNPKADQDTISRVFRLMAQRLHPDNQETGDEKQFRAVVHAHHILSDPERRAAYDQRRLKAQQEKWKLAAAAGVGNSPVSEKEKRRAVLSLLYAKRVQDPHSLGVQATEMEDLLGIAREHLEFSLWYLRESALVTRSDNGKFSITAKGVDDVEARQEVEAAAKTAERLEQAASLPGSRQLGSASSNPVTQ